MKEIMDDMSALPKISIVTPSYNYGEFLEEAILSILNQNYPNLEYIIIDGGSTDGSVDIIRKYENHLAYWESTKDRGPYHALNKGFQRATGEIMAWLNADDKYCPWALMVNAQVFSQNPTVNWITSSFPLHWDKDGIAISCSQKVGYSRKMFFEGRYVCHRPHAQPFIQQESTFWRRLLWEKAGGYINENYKYAADFDLWNRFFHHDEIFCVRVPLGGFRKHGLQRSSNMDQYLEEVDQILLSNEPVSFSKRTGKWIRTFIKKLRLDRLPVIGWMLRVVFFTCQYQDIVSVGPRGQAQWKIKRKSSVSPW